MSTVFEKIISGDIPGRFEWADQDCVVLSTIEPIAPGHVLVVPRHPWPRWTDIPADVLAHLVDVARTVGLAQEDAFSVPRSGLMIAGFEVPHTHLHVIPMRTQADIAFGNARPAPGEELDRTALALRAALVRAGHGAHVPPELGSPELD